MNNKMKRVRDKGAYLGRAVVNKERCGKRVKKRYSGFLQWSSIMLTDDQ